MGRMKDGRMDHFLVMFQNLMAGGNQNLMIGCLLSSLKNLVFSLKQLMKQISK